MWRIIFIIIIIVRNGDSHHPLWDSHNHHSNNNLFSGPEHWRNNNHQNHHPWRHHGPPYDHHGPTHGHHGPPQDHHGPPRDYHGPPYGYHGLPHDHHSPLYGYQGLPHDYHGPPHDHHGPPHWHHPTLSFTPPPSGTDSLSTTSTCQDNILPSLPLSPAASSSATIPQPSTLTSNSDLENETSSSTATQHSSTPVIPPLNTGMPSPVAVVTSPVPVTSTSATAVCTPVQVSSSTVSVTPSAVPVLPETTIPPIDWTELRPSILAAWLALLVPTLDDNMNRVCEAMAAVSEQRLADRVVLTVMVGATRAEEVSVRVSGRVLHVLGGGLEAVRVLPPEVLPAGLSWRLDAQDTEVVVTGLFADLTDLRCGIRLPINTDRSFTEVVYASFPDIPGLQERSVPRGDDITLDYDIEAE